MAVRPLIFRWGSGLIWKVLFAIMILSVLFGVHGRASKDKPKKKKDIRDFNDADMERLFQEWEVSSFLQYVSVGLPWGCCIPQNMIMMHARPRELILNGWTMPMVFDLVTMVIVFLLFKFNKILVKNLFKHDCPYTL